MSIGLYAIMKAEIISLFALSVLVNFIFIFLSSKDFYSKLFSYRNKFSTNKLIDSATTFITKLSNNANKKTFKNNVKQVYNNFYDNYSYFYKFIKFFLI